MIFPAGYFLSDSQKQVLMGGDAYVHDCGDSIHVLKLIKLHILNVCSLLYVRHTSIQQSKQILCSFWNEGVER